MEIAQKTVRLFTRRAYVIRKIDYFLIRISSNNLHSQHVFEKMGAIKIGEEETAFSKLADTICFLQITNRLAIHPFGVS